MATSNFAKEGPANLNSNNSHRASHNVGVVVVVFVVVYNLDMYFIIVGRRIIYR